MSHAPTSIIGHRNPDADAICSAIAYADFKSRRGLSGYVAARCGNSNARIDAILEAFGQSLPLFLGDVTPRVKDIMVRDVIKIRPDATCAEALELIDAHDVRVLPVVKEDDQMLGFVSIFQLGDFFIPKIRQLREMRRVFTSISSVARALNARVLNLCEPERTEELFVRIGAMDIRSFGKFAEQERVTPEQSIIVVGDRWDIQQRSLQIGVRLLVVTGNLDVDPEAIEEARKRGVSLIVSPYDSASTAWIIRTASTLDRLIAKDYVRFGPEERLQEVRRKVAAANVPAFFVTEDDGRLVGLFTKSNILKPIQTRLILVDHNEISQAVPGANEVHIEEIIDHHRIGALPTQQPILFINEPVGSTCTVVADLFRREGLEPSREIAGVMMGGIISDTLNLNSPTSTEKDYNILAWLEKLAGVEAKRLADTIFSSGSVILASPPEAVVRSDYKVYQEEGARFSISQVEELGFGNFWNNADALAGALEKVQQSENLLFSGLLVTDINTQNSVFLIKGDREVIEAISYQKIDASEIFDMPGVVSRKKQLIPYVTSVLRTVRPSS
jgi:manganese-dependent inorganic pyrophosphatase